MSPRRYTTWIGESEPEEQGSFCDTQSGRHYDNGDIVEAVRREDQAFDRNEDVIWTDASIDPDVTYEVPEDQRFNFWRSESDSQSLPGDPKLGPAK